MYTCIACNVDFYHNPDIRTVFSAVCDHRLCEPCVKRLFQHGRAYSCPACGVRVRAEEFSELSREGRVVESETNTRREIYEIYCKTEEDFATREEHDDFLEMREDIIYKLTNATLQSEVQDLRRRIEKYREENAAQILQVKSALPRKRAQKILDIIEKEGNFCSNVNIEWGEREKIRCEDSVSEPQHPFRERYRDLLLLGGGSHDAESLSPRGGLAGSNSDGGAASPRLAPQPLLVGDECPVSPLQAPSDPVQHASGGGQMSGICRAKARHFFFADLTAAAIASTRAAATAV
eukprot:TRINITY_DN49198_c0_g1_i1.p1 TRINITY_DN49198_c0_g1~~TRINITY_DN49198_c0_g1_i1.p1  ORF type:complete len:292 (-),score=42.90 TRINITY_DN49198_c0_g1_i1:431-1306(-)